MDTETIKIESVGLTLSLLVWRKFKKPNPGFIERVLALNPGLAALGPALPPGLSILFPVDQAPASNFPAVIVQLWD